MGLFDDVEDKFKELQDGSYVVKVEGFSREQTIHGAKPIMWQLRLMSNDQGQLPLKFSHIENNAGFHILMRELKDLGYGKPANSQEFEAIIHSLVGCLLEIQLTTTNKEEGYRDIKFLRKLS
ncbi:hypothetical protein [Bacillus sp. 1P06AnD]|uniref:hypothetical protein n=1 Tax=Bacillus sp. 1P06AnD TaxID=3132208 RepID=UPI0039A3AEC4